MDKLIYRDIEYKIGVSYQAIKELQLRLGVNPSNETFSFGVALNIKDSYRIATAYSLQDNLGNTPAISLHIPKVKFVRYKTTSIENPFFDISISLSS
jgi:hypothetical protein